MQLLFETESLMGKKVRERKRTQCETWSQYSVYYHFFNRDMAWNKPTDWV